MHTLTYFIQLNLTWLWNTSRIPVLLFFTLEVRKPKVGTVIWPAQDLCRLVFRFTCLENSLAKVRFVLETWFPCSAPLPHSALRPMGGAMQLSSQSGAAITSTPWLRSLPPAHAESTLYIHHRGRIWHFYQSLSQNTVRASKNRPQCPAADCLIFATKTLQNTVGKFIRKPSQLWCSCSAFVRGDVN